MKKTLLASLILSILVIDTVSVSSAKDSCAILSYESPCKDVGVAVYVVNRISDKPVKATVRMIWQEGVKKGESYDVYTIPAGGKESLGCSRRSQPDTTYWFYLIECSVQQQKS